MNNGGEKVKARGHWIVRVHPEHYESSRIERVGDLEKAVRDCAVALRGWDFPHYSPQDKPTRSGDYV